MIKLAWVRLHELVKAVFSRLVRVCVTKQLTTATKMSGDFKKRQ